MPVLATQLDTRQQETHISPAAGRSPAVTGGLKVLRARPMNLALGDVVILGQAPGNYERYDPEKHALFPYPTGCAGHRLWRMTGITRLEFISISRRNLLDYYPGLTSGGQGDYFPLDEARDAATELIPELFGRNVLMVGHNVAKAFRFDKDPRFTWHSHGSFNYACIPHTSGRNRWYNDRINKRTALRFLRRFGRQVLAGEPEFS